MPTLDASQLAFCESSATNVRLLAPAGCGKTLCLLHRCLHLAKMAYPRRPRFLLVTFTRAARDELVGRMATDATFADIRDNVEVTTLNAWGYRRIKNTAFHNRLLTSDTQKHYAMANQLQPVWRKYKSIENAITAKKRRRGTNPTRDLMVVLDAFKSLGFDHERHVNLDAFSNHWEALTDQGLDWRLSQLIDDLTRINVLEQNETGKRPSMRVIWNRFFRFWREAAGHLIDSASFTLEDQKYFAYLDERSNIDKGSYLSGAASYDHVFVDEFQDINPLDMALVQAIADRNRATLTIAGDDDQAIFEWRGATPEYILNPDEYLGRRFETYTLAVNYRSPSNVVDLSQNLIANNTRRVRKSIRSHDNSVANQARVEIKTTDSLASSMEFVNQIVQDTIKGGRSPSRIALIGRKRSQIIPYQIYFASKDIPFCAAEDLQLFLSNTFENLLELIEIKERSEDRQRPIRCVDDLLELCDRVRRFGLNKTDREALQAHLVATRPNSIIAALNSLNPIGSSSKLGSLDAKTRLMMFEAIEEFLVAETVSDALQALSDRFVGLQYDFGKAATDIFYADPPFLHLAEYALGYDDDYERFRKDIELAKDTLVNIPPFDDESTKYLPAHPLHLMTALRAKGKEFDTVVLLDAVDGIWPNTYAETEAQLEAERRVFYVAFTRARKHVAIMVDPLQPPSPFIYELGLGDQLPRNVAPQFDFSLH